MSLLIKSKVSIIKVTNRSKISETAHKFFAAQFRNALRAWVKEILLKTPDYTGTYRGTIIPVGKALKGGGWYAPGPIYSYDKEARSRHKAVGYKVIRGYGTFRLGEAAGATYAHFNIDTTIPGYYVFTYSTNLPWAIWNEMYPAPQWLHLHMPTPSNAITTGNAAFKIYLEEEMPLRAMYKKLAKIMIKVTIKSA